MAPAIFALHSISALAADFLVASIWQGLVLAGGVAVLLRWLPGLTATVRSGIWTAVLLLAMFFPGLSLALQGGPAAATAHAGLLHASEAWSLALLSVWVVFALLRIGQLVTSATRLRGLASRAVAATPSESVAALLRGSRRRVELCLSAEVDRPSVAGFFRPRILLSPELLARLSAPELEQVVLHEMEHLRRYDDWTNLLQKLSLALLPLHPVLLWLDRQMCLERELACDDGVLRQTRGRKAYAACLARLAEDSMVRRGFSLALGTLGSRERPSELTGRVHRILRAPEKRMSRGRVSIATAGLLAAVFAGAAGLARSPQLISFTSAGQPLPAAQNQNQAQNQMFRIPATSAPHVEAASFHPAVSFQFPATGLQSSATGLQSPAPHQTLVKAVIPERRSLSLLTIATRKSTHRVRLVNAMQRRISSPGPYMALTAWRSPAIPDRLTVAFTQDSQFLYAAVPLRNGWLIIQL